MFSAIVLLLILLIVAYFATQGMVSALLALVTAIFSSILAMGLMEPLGALVGKYWRMDLARGVAFLVIFLVCFAITRVAADAIVPKNIKLPKLVNRVVGGAVGLFVAWVVMGNLIIGIEMLPLPSAILGFDRYPAGMQGDIPSEAAAPANAPFSPDKLVMAIWNGTSGRALGGSRPWVSVHPNISTESSGYRFVPGRGSMRTVTPGAFNVEAAWTTREPQEMLQRGVPVTSGRRMVVVRTKVDQGEGVSDPSGSDSGPTFFRISPTQVRLVTDKNRQYYPMGILEHGREFLPLHLDGDHLVDDFVSGSVIEDWVFEIPEEENARVIEMKQWGRKDLAELAGGVSDKPQPAAAAVAYPKHPYHAATLAVTFDPKGKTITSGQVYVLAGIPGRDLGGLLRPYNDKVPDLNADSNPPLQNIISSGKRAMIDYSAPDADKSYGWQEILPALLAGQTPAAASDDWKTYTSYFDENSDSSIIKMWKSSGRIVASGTLERGKTEVDVNQIPPGDYSLVITMQTENGFYVWCQNKPLKAAEALTVSPDNQAMLAITK